MNSWYFETFSQNGLKIIKNPLGISLLATWESDEPENLIKPEENESFGGAPGRPGGLRPLYERTPPPP